MTPFMIISSHFPVSVSFQQWQLLLACINFASDVQVSSYPFLSGRAMVSHHPWAAGEKISSARHLFSVFLRSSSMKPFVHSSLAVQLSVNSSRYSSSATRKAGVHVCTYWCYFFPFKLTFILNSELAGRSTGKLSSFPQNVISRKPENLKEAHAPHLFKWKEILMTSKATGNLK